MNEHELRREAAGELSGRLDAMRKDVDDAVLGMSSSTITTITLACGGPSAWIEYDHDRGSARFYTTAPGYENSTKCQEIEIHADEAQEIETLLGLDDYAVSGGYPVDGYPIRPMGVIE